MSSQSANRNRKLGMTDNPIESLNGAEGGVGGVAPQPVPGGGDASVGEGRTATPLRLLILDTRPADAQRMVHELRRAGFDPDWQRVESEPDFLARLDPRPDVILANYNLSRFDALRALHRLRERGLEIPFIVVTDPVGDEVAAECVKQGATDYLLKDWLSRLGPAVAQALEERRLRDTNLQGGPALRENGGGIRHMVDMMPTLVRLSGQDGRWAFFNQRWLDFTGRSMPQEIADGWADAVHPEDRQRCVEAFAAASHARQPFRTEYRLKRADAEYRWILEIGVPRSTPEGSFAGYISSAMDITERKQAEERLLSLYQASLQIQERLGLQDRLDRLLKTAQAVLGLDRVAIFLADPHGGWLEAAASFGTESRMASMRVPIGPAGGALAQAFLSGKMVTWDGRGPVPDPLRLKPPYDRIAAFRTRTFANVPLLAQGRTIGVLGVGQKPSGRPLDATTLELLQLFASQAALAIEHGRHYETQRMASLQLEASVEDRTRDLHAANARLQEAIRQAEEAPHLKLDILANMSYEFRTRLNTILGFLDLLTQQTLGPLTAKQARYVNIIHGSSEQLLAAITSLLDLAQVESGKLTLQPESFTLHEALEAALADVRPQANAKGLILELHADEAPAVLTADPVRFKQILYNLLSNAIKFTPDAGQITVATRGVHSSQFTVDRPEEADRQSSTVNRQQVGESIEISVQDTGIGITAEDLPKLFIPLGRQEPSLIKQYRGAGLGLALTKRLVELHGGRIWANSAGAGRGSTFTVCLPLAPHAAPERQG